MSEVTLQVSHNEAHMIRLALSYQKDQAVDTGCTVRARRYGELYDKIVEQSLVKQEKPKISFLAVVFSDPKNGWYVQRCDSNGIQIGEASYVYRKADAIDLAKRERGERGENARTLPIWVHKRNGKILGKA